MILGDDPEDALARAGQDAGAVEGDLDARDVTADLEAAEVALDLDELLLGLDVAVLAQRLGAVLERAEQARPSRSA